MGKHKYKRNRWKFQSKRMMQSFFLKFYYHSFTHFPSAPLLDTATIISCWDDSNHFLTDLHASSPVQPQSVLNTARVIMEITGWILSLFCSEVSNGFSHLTQSEKKRVLTAVCMTMDKLNVVFIQTSSHSAPFLARSAPATLVSLLFYKCPGTLLLLSLWTHSCLCLEASSAR